MTARKKLNKLNRHAYRKRFHPQHPIHEQLKQQRTEYAKQIENTKNNHWNEFISNATDTSIWNIHNYISKDATDGGRSQIPTLLSGHTSNEEETHESNESKSEILHQYFCPDMMNQE